MTSDKECDICHEQIHSYEDSWIDEDSLYQICDSCITDAIEEKFDNLDFHEKTEMLGFHRQYGEV
jgi:hypothetical protein